MRSATSGDTKDLAPFINTMFCSGCGLCEIYSCPQGLSPRTLITTYKEGLKKNGVKIPDVALSEVDENRKLKLVPIKRLTARLGLTKYDSSAPIELDEVKGKRLKISLVQNIGVPDVPVVNAGDIIKKGELLASHDKKALGVPLHSPANGKIIDANKHFIIIECEK